MEGNAGTLNSIDLTATKIDFEDAMLLTGFGKFNVFNILFCGFILMATIVETLGLSFVIPVSQCDLQMTFAEKVWLPVVPFIAIIVTSYGWGYLADTRGRKTVLVFSMAVGSFFSVLSSFSPNFYTFFFMRLLAGLFIAGPAAIGYAYLGELNPRSHRDLAITLGNALMAFGLGVVPIFAWAIIPLDFNVSFIFIEYRPWRLLVAVFALPFIISSILFIKFPESPKFLYARGKTDEALDVLKWIYSVNNGKSVKNFPVSSSQLSKEPQNDPKRSFFSDVWYQTVPLFSPEFRIYTLLCCLLQFGIFASTNGFYLWLPEIFDQILNQKDNGTHTGKNICTMFDEKIKTKQEEFSLDHCDDTLNIATFPVSITFSAILSVFTICAAFLLKLVGKRIMVVGIFGACGTACFLIHWLTNAWVAIIAYSFTLICGVTSGMINAYVVEIFPTDVRGMAVCISLMIGRIGSIAGTNTFGYVINTACVVTFFLFAVVMYVMIPLVIGLPEKRERKNPSQPQQSKT